MPRLIDRSGLVTDGWVWFTGDASAVKPRARLLLPLDVYREYRDRWLTHDGALGVLLAPSDDPATIASEFSHLSLIAVDFPNFTDGRGYSIARLLRDRHHYEGELRAVGDILRDQLFLLSRVGFDTFALRDDQDVVAALGAFADFSEVYQAAWDSGPLFDRRFAQAA